MGIHFEGNILYKRGIWIDDSSPGIRTPSLGMHMDLGNLAQSIYFHMVAFP